MARKPVLTEKQWPDVLKRVPPLGNETVRSVAKELGISESVIRNRIKTHEKPINALANQIATVEKAFENLPIKTQIKVRSLADRLKGISDHLASAAEYGAMTAHRVTMLANTEVQKVDDANPLSSIEALKSVSALTRLANDSAQIGLNLLAANKETVIRVNADTEKRKPLKLSDFYGETDNATS